MERERNHAGFALAILFAINLLNFFDRNLFGALAEPIKREWSLSDTRDWLFGFRVYRALCGGGISAGQAFGPGSAAADFCYWSGGVESVDCGFGIGWNYAALFVVRLGVGIGEASCAPASNSMIGDYYPATAGAGAGDFYAGVADWEFSVVVFRWALGRGLRLADGLLHCVFAGIAFGALALLIEGPARGGAEISRHASRTHEGSAFWCVLKIPTVCWLIVSGALHNFMMYTIAVFVPGLSRVITA